MVVYSKFTMQQAQFYLGYIAGEGCFAVAIRTVERSNAGIRFYPYFLVTVDKRDREILERMCDDLGGSVRESNGMVYFRVNGFNGSDKIIDFIEENRNGAFEQTAKYESYKRWCDWIDNYETPQTRQKVTELIETSQKINPSNSGGGKSVEEWLKESKV